MRPLLVAGVCLVLLLSGCVESSGVKGPTTGAVGGATRTLFDNSTVHGKLSNSPHLKINSGMTLAWNFPNATREKPGVGATLVQLLDSYKVSHQAFDGDFVAVAFIPVETGRAVTACDAQDKAVKSFLRYRDGGNNNRFGTITGTFEKGWYHAVLVTFEAASFTLSFDAEKEVKPRTLPAPDPYIVVGGAGVAGGREIAQNVPGEGPWFAWAYAEVTGSGNVDGGRTHKVEVGCQAGTRQTNPPGTSFGNQNNRPAAAAMGPSGAFDVKSTYAPTLAQTASSTTALNYAYARLLPIPLEAAGAAATSKAA